MWKAPPGARRALLVAVAAGLLSGCEFQFRWIPWFSSMAEQPGIETYQEEPRPPVEGTMPIDGRRTYTLFEADAELESPLAGTEDEIARGEIRYRQFCTPCHGVSGIGDGPVMMPQRERGIPFTPALNLHTDQARGLSDGYIWGIITDGRGLMPSYRRIPQDERWYLVSYVRHLQAQGPPDASARSAAGAARSEAGADRVEGGEQP